MEAVLRIETRLINPLIKETTNNSKAKVLTWTNGQYAISWNIEQFDNKYYSDISIEFDSISTLFNLALKINQ